MQVTMGVEFTSVSTHHIPWNTFVAQRNCFFVKCYQGRCIGVPNSFSGSPYKEGVILTPPLMERNLSFLIHLISCHCMQCIMALLKVTFSTAKKTSRRYSFTTSGNYQQVIFSTAKKTSRRYIITTSGNYQQSLIQLPAAGC